MINWHQYLAMQIVNGEYHTTEQLLDRALCLDAIDETSYQRDRKRLLWWRLWMIDRIAAPGSHEQKRSNIRIAVQHFGEVCEAIALPIQAKERAIPPQQRLTQLSRSARRKLKEMQRKDVSPGTLAWRLDKLEQLFTDRLAEVLEMKGLTPEERADRTDDLVASYYDALGETLCSFPC